ncbi:hypothetical protein Ahy_B02g058554 [Arachis hypogaea]|uniref:Transposase MuDR plant domain-containing protein n=1 Tax=Arachis hypogaea TaxID=3818 RepID=A0A445AEV1_ARAHY|nr:hypothetical protein Ahy_B02g058554 [Arachis hypogaea]
MRVLDLDALHALEFSKDLNIDHFIVNNDKLVLGKMFMNKETVIARLKAYNIKKSVDYIVKESPTTTYYCSLENLAIFWEVKNYDGPHSYTQSRLSQNHYKLDSSMVTAHIEPMITTNPSMKVKLIIIEIQSHFNYTPTNRKVWLVKQRVVEKAYDNWETSYQELLGKQRMSKLKQNGKCFKEWVDEIKLDRWSQAFDRGRRYGHMIANLVECTNFVLKGAQNLPITALVRSTYH